jgi:ComF family protein
MQTRPPDQMRVPRPGPRGWLSFVLDLLYPPRCGGCDAAGHGLWCEACDALARRLPAGERAKPVALAAPFENVEFPVVSAAVFAAPLREAIHALKYDGTPGMAQPLARLMAEVWPQSFNAGLIVPVPLHPRRQRERGYNQSELLARHLSRQSGVPLELRALRRARHTDQQAHLGAAERRLNVQGAFTASTQHVNGKPILLVDDVLTTGATLGECAMALLGAGASQVSAITLARAG